MTKEQEYIFGFKRYLKKIIFYNKGRDIDSLIQDELSFDAISYCLINLASITSLLSEEFKNKYNKEFNFFEFQKDLDELINSKEYINLDLFDYLVNNQIIKIYNLINNN